MMKRTVPLLLLLTLALLGVVASAWAVEPSTPSAVTLAPSPLTGSPGPATPAAPAEPAVGAPAPIFLVTSCCNDARLECADICGGPFIFSCNATTCAFTCRCKFPF